MPVLDPSSTSTDELAERFAGPDGLASFNATVRERRSAYFPQRLTEDETNHLFTTAMLGDLLHSSLAIAESTDVFTGGHLVRLKDILHRSDSDTIDVVGQQLSLGATLRFRDLDHHVQQLHDLGRSVATIFGGATTINAYLTPSGQPGFPPHFDNTDVFVLQLLGAKRWTLFEDYTNRQELPLRDLAWDPKRYRPIGGGQSCTLRPGDVVYISRGGMHAAECLEDISFHLTISLDPLAAYDALRTLLEQWSVQNLESRRRISPDSVEATHALRHLAADFERWLGQQETLHGQAAAAETGNAGCRFREVIERARSSGNAT